MNLNSHENGMLDTKTERQTDIHKLVSGFGSKSRRNYEV